MRSGVGSERKIKIKVPMAAAAGKKCRTTMSLFMEVFGLEVDLGRRSVEWQMVHRTKRSMDEPGCQQSVTRLTKAMSG